MSLVKRILLGLLAFFSVTYASGAELIESYAVAKNDTLTRIAEKHGKKDWHEVYLENKDQIKNPNRIYPGQVLRFFFCGTAQHPDT